MSRSLYNGIHMLWDTHMHRGITVIKTAGTCSCLHIQKICSSLEHMNMHVHINMHKSRHLGIHTEIHKHISVTEMHKQISTHTNKTKMDSWRDYYMHSNTYIYGVVYTVTLTKDLHIGKHIYRNIELHK